MTNKSAAPGFRGGVLFLVQNQTLTFWGTKSIDLPSFKTWKV